MTLVCGIDPGLATGGMVLLRVQPEEVLAVQRLKTKPGDQSQVAGEKQFAQAVARGRLQVQQISAFLQEHDPDFISIESFVDLASRKGKEDRLRWTTPLVIGMIDAELQKLGMAERVRYQNPSILSQFRTEMSQLGEANKNRKRPDLLLPGDHLISNPHLLSAWAHASWRVARLQNDDASDMQ